MLPYTFFNDVEKRLKYILYGDTDSTFIYVERVKVNLENLLETIDIANKISHAINDGITEHLNTNVLPKLGIDPQYNKTTFKTELVSNAIFFLGIKKNYAYRMLAKEGNIIDSQPIKYVGLISKSDMTKYTQTILKGLVEEIMFDIKSMPEDKKQKAVNYIIGFRNKIHEDVINLRFDEIGQPKKWSIKTKNNEDTWQVYGMRLYNTIMNEPVFKPMSGGLAVAINITNPTDFLQKVESVRHTNEMYLNDSPISKLNYIVFPYTFNVEEVKTALKHFNIEVNEEDLWSKICGTNIQDIMSLFNQYSNPINQLIGKI